jgi:anti-sigma B factor antagonist
MTPFSVEVESKGNHSAQVAINGALDAHTFEQFFNTMSQLIDGGTLRIVLDLRQMNYITSVGMNFLVNMRLQRKKAGGDVIIIQPQPAVLNLLDMIGFLQVLVVAETEEEAWSVFTDEQEPPPDPKKPR